MHDPSAGPGQPSRPPYTIHPARPAARGRGGIVLVIVSVALLAAAAAAALVIAVEAWSAAGALTVQARQLRDQVASLRATEKGDYSAVNAKVDGAGRQLAPLLTLGASVCSQDLTGPSGPAQFYFACTDVKPAG